VVIRGDRVLHLRYRGWSLTAPAESGAFGSWRVRPWAGRAGAGYRLGSERGSPNQGRTLLSKRVMAQIRSPVRVST
jgi:hypothetical protein